MGSQRGCDDPYPLIHDHSNRMTQTKSTQRFQDRPPGPRDRSPISGLIPGSSDSKDGIRDPRDGEVPGTRRKNCLGSYKSAARCFRALFVSAGHVLEAPKVVEVRR